MYTPKVGFCIADYAKKNHMGIGNFRLKDGSSIKVLNHLKRDVTEIYQMKNGKLLESKKFSGEDKTFEAIEYIMRLEKEALNPGDVDRAWAHSLDINV